MSTSTCLVESVTGGMLVRDGAPRTSSSFDHVGTSPFRSTSPRKNAQNYGVAIPSSSTPYLNYQLPPPMPSSSSNIHQQQPQQFQQYQPPYQRHHHHHQQQQQQLAQPMSTALVLATPTQSQTSPSNNNNNPSNKRSPYPHLIATISAGFEKGDYLIREEKGSNIYFDFFEEAYNFISTKGYCRMTPQEEEEYTSIIRMAHKSVPGGMRFNSGRLLMVLKKQLLPVKIVESDDEDVKKYCSSRQEEECVNTVGSNAHERKSKHKKRGSGSRSPSSSNKYKGSGGKKNGQSSKLRNSTGTAPTDSDTASWDSSSKSNESNSSGGSSKSPSHTNSSAYSSYVDSWE